MDTELAELDSVSCNKIKIFIISNNLYSYYLHLHREILQFTTVVETSEFDVHLPKTQCFYDNKTL